MGNSQDLSKERRKELKAPYRQKRESDSESCDKFVAESRQRQISHEQRKAQLQHEIEEQSKRAETLGNIVSGALRAGKFVALASVLVIFIVLIGRWTSDFTDSTQIIVSDIEECFGKLESRLRWLDSYYGDKISPDSNAGMLAQSERDEINAELAKVKDDRESSQKRGEIRKTRLSFGNYQCEASRIFGRYEERRNAEQRMLDQERLLRGEEEINAAMDAVLAGWKNKAVEHYVADGAGPRVDTFVLKDGSSVLCTTSFRNGIRAVSCNR